MPSCGSSSPVVVDDLHLDAEQARAPASPARRAARSRSQPSCLRQQRCRRVPSGRHLGHAPGVDHVRAEARLEALDHRARRGRAADHDVAQREVALADRPCSRPRAGTASARPSARPARASRARRASARRRSCRRAPGRASPASRRTSRAAYGMPHALTWNIGTTSSTDSPRREPRPSPVQRRRTSAAPSSGASTARPSGLPVVPDV